MRLVVSFISGIFLLSFSLVLIADDNLVSQKIKGPLSVVVLGSGGPVATSEGRASSGFLIFTDGKPRILMDMGGGTFKTLAQSGVNIANLEHFLLTHLHLDHTGDISAIVKTIFFHNLAAGTKRTADFNFYGPASANAQFSNLADYIDQHYEPTTGVERYLNGFAGAIKAGVFNRKVVDLPSNFTSDAITTVFEDNGLVVKSIAVNHGPVPSVAYRIEYKGYSIVWSGDTTSKTGNMAKLAADADILIYDTAIMDDAPVADSVFHKLHTNPTRMAQVALEANPKKLVLSHITPITAQRLDEVKTIIKDAGYQGKIKYAKDLKVYNTADH